jgi:hypothetical protein
VVLPAHDAPKPVAEGGRTLRTRQRPDHDGISAEAISMTVKFGGIEFDNVFYDQDADVLIEASELEGVLTPA